MNSRHSPSSSQTWKTRLFLPTWFIYSSVILLGIGLTTVSFGSPQNPQMELRSAEEYAKKKFSASKPAVGEKAPNLDLRTLNGELVSLSDFLGKRIVVIKSGYT